MSAMTDTGREERLFETNILWEGRRLRLSYRPRRWGFFDHAEISAEDGQPLPITETGYRSHFFGPVEPELSLGEVEQMFRQWLDEEAAKPGWQSHLRSAAQLSLF